MRGTVRDGKVGLRTALQYAANEGYLRLMLSDCEAEAIMDAK